MFRCGLHRSHLCIPQRELFVYCVIRVWIIVYYGWACGDGMLTKRSIVAIDVPRSSRQGSSSWNRGPVVPNHTSDDRWMYRDFVDGRQHRPFATDGVVLRANSCR